ncbi:hypothetical protein [Bradyrhizobium sp.]|uniref:hypothetical protein n=1 Tax=Bradyrhizobium sp. TaxID=376 RepID=UPI001DEF2EFB|nr:hypothetical protein [Bradyrhizobium sp.]MBI5322368.1 hypothetical protein [Bradyrhizobium sp.]
MLGFARILARRATWQASTALVSTALAALSIPQPALAACDVTVNPNTITCAANTTTTPALNLNAAHPSSSDSVQQFTTPGPLTLTFNPGVTVDGQGFQIVSNTGAAINVSNAGVINGGAFGLLFDSPASGSVTYTGNGNISGGNGLYVNTPRSIDINTGTGSITGTAPGSSAIFAFDNFSGAGNFKVTTSGAISGGDYGIFALANTGTVTVNVNGGTVSGGRSGISAGSASASDVVVNANAGTISSGNTAISMSGGGNVTFNGNGSVITGGNALSVGGQFVSVNLTAGSVAATSRGVRVFSTGSTSVFSAPGYPSPATRVDWR